MHRWAFFEREPGLWLEHSVNGNSEHRWKSPTLPPSDEWSGRTNRLRWRLWRADKRRPWRTQLSRIERTQDHRRRSWSIFCSLQRRSQERTVPKRKHEQNYGTRQILERFLLLTFLLPSFPFIRLFIWCCNKLLSNNHSSTSHYEMAGGCFSGIRRLNFLLSK